MRWTLATLRDFGERIEDAARGLGLDPYPVRFEIISPREMAEEEALLAMPTRYSHWSFGKAADLSETARGFFGFGAAEIVANANPSRAVLLDDNPLELQLLVMAHVMGHLDFFHHNRHFRETQPETVLDRMAANRRRVGEIRRAMGERAVERVLSAAHTIRFARPFPSSKNRPSLLRIVSEQGRDLADWERELLRLVDEETEYFVPQLETKVLNEGWASYWQLKILERVSGIEDRIRDAMRIAHAGIALRFPNTEEGENPIQPYLVGFRLFQDIECRWDRKASGILQQGELWDGLTGREKLFLVRKVESDASAVQNYLTEPLARHLLLFSDGIEGGWPAFAEFFPKMFGLLGSFPQLETVSTNLRNQGWLLLEHFGDEFRELDADDTRWTLMHLFSLWRRPVVLRTGKWVYAADAEGVKIFDAEKSQQLPLP